MGKQGLISYAPSTSWSNANIKEEKSIEEKSRKEKRKKYKSLEDSICLIVSDFAVRKLPFKLRDFKLRYLVSK